MFDYSGGKIKRLAKILFIIFLILCIPYIIVSWLLTPGMSAALITGTLCIVCWIAWLLTHSFAQLTDTTETAAYSLRRIKKQLTLEKDDPAK